MDTLTRTRSGALTRKKAPKPTPPDSFNFKGPIILQSNRCGNCDKTFSKTRQCARKFVVTRSKDKDSTPKDNSANKKTYPSVTVDISTALTEVYEWRFGKENCGKLSIHKSVALCSTCGLSLAKLYGAIKTFDELGVPLSYVGLTNQKLFNGLKQQRRSEARQSSNSNITPRRDRQTSGSSIGSSDDEQAPFDDPDPDYAPSDVEEVDPSVKNETSSVIEPPQQPVPEVIDSPDEENVGEHITKENLCYICGAGFDKPTNLKRHLLLTHEIGDRTRDFVCSICGRAYFFAHLLKNHMAYHFDARPFACSAPGCEFKFKTNNALSHHVVQVHTGERRFPCRFCPKRFKIKRDKRVHETYVHKTPKGLKNFECPYGCGVSYKRQHCITSHARNDCPKRPYGDGSEDEVDEAVRSIEGVEGAERPPRPKKPRPPKPTYPCNPECGKVYKSKASLLDHQRYRCDFSAESKTTETEEKESSDVINKYEDSAPIPVSDPAHDQFDNHLQPESVVEEPMDLMNIIDQMA